MRQFSILKKLWSAILFYDTSTHEISRILDDDWKFGEQFYLVGFKGYSEVYDNEWFRRSSLMKDAAKLVLAYEKAKHITVDQPVSKTVRRRKSRR